MARFSGVPVTDRREWGKCQSFPADARLLSNPLFGCSDLPERADASKAMLSANISRITSYQTGTCVTKTLSAKALLNNSDSSKQQSTQYQHSQQETSRAKAFSSGSTADLRKSSASRNKGDSLNLKSKFEAPAGSPYLQQPQQLKRTRSELLSIREQPNAEFSSLVQQPKTEFSSLREQLKTEIRNKQAVRQQLEESTSIINSLKLKLRLALTDKKTARDQTETKDSLNAALRQQLADCQEQLAAVQAEKKVVKEKLYTALADKKAAKEQAEHADLQMDTLKQQLADCQKQLVTVQAEKGVLKQELDLALADKTSALDQVQHKHSQMETLRQQLTEHQAQLAALQAEHDLLKQDYKIALHDIELSEQQQMEHALLKEEFDIAMQDIERRAQQQAAQHKHTQQLEEELRQYRDDFPAIHVGNSAHGVQEITALKACVYQLQQQLQESLKQHQVEMDSFRAEHHQNMAAQQKAYEKLKEMNHALAQEKSATSMVCEEQRHTISNLSKQLEEKEKSNTELHQKVHDFQDLRYNQLCQSMLTQSATSKQQLIEVCVLQDKLEDAIADSNRWQEMYAQQSEQLGQIKMRFKSRLANMSSATSPPTTPVRQAQTASKEDDQLLSSSPVSVLDWY